MTHEYNSSEYYAQTFKEFLPKYFKERYGFEVPIKQSLGTVIFNFHNKKWSLDFNVRESVPYVLLEKEVENGWSTIKESKLKIRRTGKGKVSMSTYKQLFEEIILPSIKDLINSE